MNGREIEVIPSSQSGTAEGNSLNDKSTLSTAEAKPTLAENLESIVQAQPAEPLSFGEKIARENTRLAKQLHDSKIIYALYGLIDGQLVSYSSIKYFFDFVPKSANNPMRDWYKSPAGLIVASIESVILMGLSVVANTSEEDDPDVYKKAVKKMWPYIRSIVGELKDASSAVSNGIKVASLFQNTKPTHLMLPASVTIGILSVANRIWQRQLQDQRKELKKELKKLLKEITAFNKEVCGDPDQLGIHQAKLADYSSKLESLSKLQQSASYSSAVYAGLVESAGSYLGLLTLVTLSSPAFIPLAASCLVFSLATITTSLYEARESQAALELEVLKIELHCKQHEIQLINAELGFLGNAKTAEAEEKKKLLEVRCATLLSEVIEITQKFDSQNPAIIGVVFKGVQGGFEAYSTFNKTILTAIALFMKTVPPTLVVSSVFVGVALLAGFTAYALVAHYYQQQAVQDALQNHSHQEQVIEGAFQKANRVVGELIKSHTPDVTSSSLVNKLLDVTGSLFSGLKKGEKLVGYVLTLSILEISLQEKLEDQPIVTKIRITVGVITSLILALRVYALNFGQAEMKEEKKEVEIVDDTIFSLDSGDELPQADTPGPADGGEAMVNASKDELSTKKEMESDSIGRHPSSFFNSTAPSPPLETPDNSSDVPVTPRSRS